MKPQSISSKHTNCVQLEVQINEILNILAKIIVKDHHSEMKKALIGLTESDY